MKNGENKKSLESKKKIKSCKISASLLAADFSNLHKEIKAMIKKY